MRVGTRKCIASYTYTLMFLVASNPSSWFNNSNIVLCTSLSPERDIWLHSDTRKRNKMAEPSKIRESRGQSNRQKLNMTYIFQCSLCAARVVRVTKWWNILLCFTTELFLLVKIGVRDVIVTGSWIRWLAIVIVLLSTLFPLFQFPTYFHVQHPAARIR